ncbi:hypothetical protein EK21DRAFT_108236 [Setomelanomma holmii]|uniref:Uncharacterized protein n=1 Tax=Setomelanomma holmii TaxID=210430 RepID=A0A9P4HFU8_9PLEO|nr:hypothetical protein EK21DRAFT_108236 [Setomelanomma holmii]
MKFSTILFTLFTSAAFALPVDDAVEDGVSIAAGCSGYHTGCGYAWAGKCEDVCSGHGGFLLMEQCSLARGRCCCKGK